MLVKDLGLVDYQISNEAMRDFTLQRNAETEDELWLLEHAPVFTQGSNGKAEHILHETIIPIVQTDRGGQVTYHGPGQLIAYTLFDLKRLGLGIREMVTRMESSVIDMLACHGIEGAARPDAPGVYVEGNKIASLGLRVKKGACYHGLSINIDMDLAPFSAINPCGLVGMEMTDFKQLGVIISMEQAKQLFVDKFTQQLQKNMS